jgi:hypothetical protein
VNPINELFARQDGLALTTQLYELGVTHAEIRRHVANQLWTKIDGHVLAVSGQPMTWPRRVRAASLALGPHAAASHGTAARMHGFDGFADHQGITFSTVQGFHHTAHPTLVGIVPLVKVHRSKLLQPGDVTRRHDIPVVSRESALVQIAGEYQRPRVERALDSALRDGVRIAQLERLISRMRRRRVAGPALLLELLAQRSQPRLPKSWFQRIVARVLATYDVHVVDEYPVRDEHGNALAFLDLALPDLKIGVECQSWEWHGTPSAQAADSVRRRKLRMRGWAIVDVWWKDLDRPDDIAAELAYLIDQRTTLDAS